MRRSTPRSGTKSPDEADVESGARGARTPLDGDADSVHWHDDRGNGGALPAYQFECEAVDTDESARRAERPAAAQPFSEAQGDRYAGARHQYSGDLELLGQPEGAGGDRPPRFTFHLDDVGPELGEETTQSAAAPAERRGIVAAPNLDRRHLDPAIGTPFDTSTPLRPVGGNRERNGASHTLEGAEFAALGGIDRVRGDDESAHEFLLLEPGT